MKYFWCALAVLVVAAGALAEPEVVTVGTHLLHIGDYSIETGSSRADFYLWFRWEGETRPDTFEIMNGEEITKALMIDEPGYLFYRIRADLHNGVDLQDYPFDVQKIGIQIEDGVLTTEDIVYKVDEKETSSSPHLEVLGWELGKREAKISQTYYDNWDESYSRYSYIVELQRPRSALFKLIIPIFFIAVTCWACFFLPLHKIGDKLVLGGTALLSSVAFHIYVTETLPPVGYLTIADKYMMSLYAFLVCALVGMIVVERHLFRERKENAERANHFYTALSLVVPFIMYGLLMLI